MPIDTSIGDMPWLTSLDAPEVSLARGVAAGAQIAGAINSAKQTSLAARRIELDAMREQRDAEEQATMLPIKVAFQKQQQELQSVALANQWQTQQGMLQGAKAFSEASALVSEGLRSDDPDYNLLRSHVYGVGAKYPFAEKAIEALIGNIDKAEATNARNKAAMAEVQARRDIASGKIPIEKQTSDMLNANQSIRMREETLGRPLTPSEREEIWQQFAIKSGETIETFTDPATGQPGFRITRGKQGTAPKDPNAPTTGTLADVQKRLPDIISSLDVGAQLRESINPSTVGVMGNLNNARNIVVSQLGAITGIPEFSNLRKEGVTDYRTLAKNFQAYSVRTLRSDSNIGEKEVARLLAAVPDVSLTEDVQSAKDKVSIMTMLMAEKGRLLATKAGMEMPKELLKPNEIKQMIKDNRMTKDEARVLLRKSPYLLSVPGQPPVEIDPFTRRAVQP